MTLTIELTTEQERVLRSKAAGSGITPEDLARQAVADLVEKGDDPEFDRIIGRVLTRNAELYRRLGNEEFRNHLEASARENAQLLKRLA